LLDLAPTLVEYRDFIAALGLRRLLVYLLKTSDIDSTANPTLVAIHGGTTECKAVP